MTDYPTTVDPTTGHPTTGHPNTGHPTTGQREIVLSLGSNIGDRLANLRDAVRLLCADPAELRGTAVSRVYETDPVGGPPQEDFLNAVLLAVSSRPAEVLLRRCQAAETALGRVRAQRWGPRTIDVDLIACDAEIRDDPELTLPHPRAHERAFVLVPWLEIAPDAMLPGRGPVAGLLAALQSAGVRPTAGAGISLPPAAREPADGERG